MFQILLHQLLFEPLLANGKEEAVTFSIEVGGVVVALEVAGAEVIVANLDDALGGVVIEDGDVVATADLANSLADGIEAGFVDIPGCDVTDASLGALLVDEVEKNIERVAEHLERVAVQAYLDGIVMTGDDDDVLRFGIELLITNHHRGTKAVASAVEGHASTVATYVLILHVQFFGQDTVPCLGLWTTMVGYVRVTDKADDGSLREELEWEQNEEKKKFFHLVLGGQSKQYSTS